MKNIWKRGASLVLALVMSCGMLVGCGDKNKGNDSSDSSVETPVTYTIQYTDETGAKQIQVEDGMPYALPSIPKKVGYTFLGLFDQADGGMQYVSAEGASLAPFTDKKNLVLFPVFAVKQYTVVLDTQGATYSGKRERTVEYNMQILNLPTALHLEHKVFEGWYTQPDCQGVKVADRQGSLPVVSILNANNFDVNNANDAVYLYAGFKTETFPVTFEFGGGIRSEEMQVEYGTRIEDIVPDTRNADGFAVSAWCMTENGSTPFTGKIQDATTLYATDWSPVIDLDSNGGKAVLPIVAKAGNAIVLPKAERANYQFMGWKNAEGTIVDYTAMPDASIRLTAVWQAGLCFDENGGTEVEDIFQAVGTTVELPVPTRDGYMFAGWYTQNQDKYTATAMPQDSVLLKAGWYKEKTVIKVVIPEDLVFKDNYNDDPGLDWSSTLDLSDIVTEGEMTTIHVNGSFFYSQDGYTTGCGAGINFYSSSTISSAYLIMGHTTSGGAWGTSTFEAVWNIQTPTVYICYYQTAFDSNPLRIKNFYLELTYPDTSVMY